MNPVDAVLAVTYRCNARCRMCNIWSAESPPELPPAVYRKLPASLRDINLTGGEPFLRDDLPEVHAACLDACPEAQTIVSTNGLLTDRIVAMAREMTKREPQIGIAVSIDGPAHVHDVIRGIPGAYQKATRTIRTLRDAGIANLRLAFTGGADNLHYMTDMYRLADRLNVQFTTAIEHSSEHFFHTAGDVTPLPLGQLEKQLRDIMQEELDTLSPKRWARAYFLQGVYAFASGRGRPLPCRAGRDHFFLDPEGRIFTCNAAPFEMGNLKTDDFDAVWSSESAAAARRKASGCQPGCWMVCTARTAIKAAWPRVLLWALARKLTGVRLGAGS